MPTLSTEGPISPTHSSPSALVNGTAVQVHLQKDGREIKGSLFLLRFLLAFSIGKELIDRIYNKRGWSSLHSSLGNPKMAISPREAEKLVDAQSPKLNAKAGH